MAELFPLHVCWWCQQTHRDSDEGTWARGRVAVVVSCGAISSLPWEVPLHCSTPRPRSRLSYLHQDSCRVFIYFSVFLKILWWGSSPCREETMGTKPDELCLMVWRQRRWSPLWKCEQFLRITQRLRARLLEPDWLCSDSGPVTWECWRVLVYLCLCLFSVQQRGQEDKRSARELHAPSLPPLDRF